MVPDVNDYDLSRGSMTSVSRPVILFRKWIGHLVIVAVWIFLYINVIGHLYDGMNSFLFKQEITKFAVPTDIERNSESGDSETESIEIGSFKFYFYCGIAGMLSSFLTHVAIVPLDLVKCRMQVDPIKYRGILTTFKSTIVEEGVHGLLKGWSPTAIGYGCQGFAKFCCYEMFKIFFRNMLSERAAYNWRTGIYLAASATAEFIADIFLVPMEAVKVRMQTQRGVPPNLHKCCVTILKSEGFKGFYKGLVLLWLRQIPYTMMKFACFELAVELLYVHVVTKARYSCTDSEQLVVTFTAGFIAGVLCAVVSHPADTIVSKLNHHDAISAVTIIRKLGFAGLWRGIFPRAIMIAFLIGVQWFIYDSAKVMLSLPRLPPTTI